jgi:hypothetical protein
MFRKCKLNGGHQTLRTGTAIQVHVPASLNEPVLEFFQVQLISEQLCKLLANLQFADHD